MYVDNSVPYTIKLQSVLCGASFSKALRNNNKHFDITETIHVNFWF